MTHVSPFAQSVRSSRPWVLAALLLMVAFLQPGFAFAAQGETSESSVQSLPEEHEDLFARTYASPELLSQGRQTQLNADLNRLSITGVEPVVFVRDASDAATNSDTFANDLLTGWPVESAPGANNGLVVVVSVDAGTPTNSSIQIAYGSEVPRLLNRTDDSLQQWAQDVVLPEVRAGETFDGLSYGARVLNGTIFDQVGILTERQRDTLNGDINRLQELGVPSVVYIETADAATGSPQQRADELRHDLGVESSPGADNGLLFLLTVDLRNPNNSTFVVSAGEHAYPIRQLDAETMQGIIDDHVMPNVVQTNEYVGIAHAIRRTINYAEYSPPVPPPLTETQDRWQLPLNIAAAVLVQVAAVGFLLTPALLERRMTLRPNRRSLMVYAIVLAPIAIVVGAIGILGRNPAAALAGLGVFVWTVAVVPLLARGDEPADTVNLSPSPMDDTGAHDASPAH